MDFSKIEMINAGAGSGKTFEITERLYRAVAEDGIPPSSVFATTFTNKAASELLQRVRQKFVGEASNSDSAKHNAVLINEARIGTLHSLCAMYLKRFAFVLGISPDVEVLEESSAARLFRRAIDEVPASKLKKLDRLGRKLSIIKHQPDDTEPLDFVKEIASVAVANGIDIDQLAGMGMDSWKLYDGLLDESCGKVDPNVSTEVFINKGKHVLNVLEDTGKAKGQGWHKTFRKILFEGVRKWSDWEKNIAFGKGNAEVAEPFTTLQSKLGQCQEFRSDIKAFTLLSFEIAADSIQRYRELKDDRGVLDFADLESIFLELLNTPQAEEVLSSELSLLMVDEFQDTNPMQLAIYLKLTNLVEKAIFVGDLKQAIYGFRGSDPELMRALQTTLKGHGVEVDKLSVSRRSTSSIVEHCNKVFSPLFGAEDAELNLWDKLKWRPSCGSPELFGFIEGGNKKQKNESFAIKLKQFIQSNPQVLDKETNQERPMLWGDIGVLVKTNGDARELAKALTEAGIPALCERPGLLEEPEVALVRALMEIAYGNENRIAFAEVRSIINSEAVDAWLPELLNDDAKPSELLFEELTEALTAIRDKKQQLSPTEMLTAVCANTPALSTIRRWDDKSFNTQQRLANLDAFHRMLEEYERENGSQGQPTTFEGLNRFLLQSAQRRADAKGAPIGQAVSVMTIHKAKGLEWPCVILGFLDKNPKDRLFGVTVHSDADAFTVEKPLKARQIRFLPPYTKGSAGNVFTSLKETQFGKQKAEKATEEEHRLLYVAFTRARNYLATLHDGKRGDKQVKSLLNECDYDFAEVSRPWPDADDVCSESQLPFVEPRTQDLMPRYIQPSSVTLSEALEAVNVSHYGEAQFLSGTIDTAKLGNALHQLIAYIVLNRDEDISRVAKRLLLPHISDEQKLKPLMTQAQRFVETIDAQFKPSSAWVEMPVSALNDKSQTIKGSIDLLLETTNGLVVIDHKLRGAETPEQQLGLIKDYGGQLNAYKKALEANGQPVNKVILHAFNSGSLIEVATV